MLATMNFSDLKQGMKVRLIRASAATSNVIRLQEMGMTEGTEFKVVKVAPLGDPVEIELRGYRLCLRKAETDGFEVEPVG